jgi:quercetin dioxygenase-like cupin family protein
MKAVNRRAALSLGLAATSAALVAADAAAQQVSAAGGKEVAPGVHRVEHGKRESMIPGYKSVSMVDIVYQPKAKLASGNPMPNDMVCHCPEGELRVKQSEGMEFVAKPGDLWTCKKGILEETENIGAGVAIMRIINLLPA